MNEINAEMPIEHTADETDPSVGKLLTSSERDLLDKAVTTEHPSYQWALALLAVDEGVTLVEAGERSGLTARQARYWRDRFLVKRMAIFPDDLQVEDAEKEKGEPEADPIAGKAHKSGGTGKSKKKKKKNKAKKEKKPAKKKKSKKVKNGKKK
ncbi:MAG TPA: helix-turn-helix domain-containing protein [Anaerolineales bacterium]|jgi:hypothetical protein|nr:helix-turn-helix domain-containing protein [Anaerolineales bacterium]